MRYFHARHRETGEDQWPLAGDDQDVPGGIDPEIWEITEIERERASHDEFVDGELRLNAASLNAALHAEIDQRAGEFRCRFITDAPGQALTYLRKEDEARRLRSGGLGPFPTIDAEAEATNVPVEELADRIVAQANAWVALGAKIEAARMAAKQAVSTAASEAAKREAAVVDWAALIDAE